MAEISEQETFPCPGPIGWDRAAQGADDAVTADPSPDLEAHGAQPRGDDARGACLLARQFGVSVQVAPHGDEVIVKSLGAFGIVDAVNSD